jgi:hypothetical protein
MIAAIEPDRSIDEIAGAKRYKRQLRMSGGGLRHPKFSSV